MTHDEKPAAVQFLTELHRLRAVAGQPSLHQLAARVGYSVSTMSRILSGKQLPDRGTLDRLLDALDVHENVQREAVRALLREAEHERERHSAPAGPPARGPVPCR